LIDIVTRKSSSQSMLVTRSLFSSVKICVKIYIYTIKYKVRSQSRVHKMLLKFIFHPFTIKRFSIPGLYERFIFDLVVFGGEYFRGVHR
jgi:hypothetical protein